MKTTTNNLQNIGSLQQQNTRSELFTGDYAAIDTEYIQTKNPRKAFDLIAIAIVDSKGNIKSRHISDFEEYPNPEKVLVEWTMSELLKYKLTIGWYSKGVRLQNKQNGTFTGKDSDLKVIDSVCKYYDIPSVIAFDKRGVPFLRGYNYSVSLRDNYYLQRHNKFYYYYHIDLYNVYKKPLVKSVIYNNKYKDLSLESVSQAILKEGKFENLKGSDIQNISKEKLIQYVTQDVSLVMKLSKHNNYEILDLMNTISIITNLPFDRVCHTGISTWWTNIIKKEFAESKQKQQELLTKKNYSGGYVIEPIKGYYQQPVYVLDVKSLYPTMMINNNISFDTVNCDCCKDDPNAKVSGTNYGYYKSKLTSGRKKSPNILDMQKENWYYTKIINWIQR